MNEDGMNCYRNFRFMLICWHVIMVVLWFSSLKLVCLGTLGSTFIQDHNSYPSCEQILLDLISHRDYDSKHRSVILTTGQYASYLKVTKKPFNTRTGLIQAHCTIQTFSLIFEVNQFASGY